MDDNLVDNTRMVEASDAVAAPGMETVESIALLAKNFDTPVEDEVEGYVQTDEDSFAD